MTNKTGRPSFQIHGARLKEHRKQANLTQAALSERLFAMDTYRDVESMKRSYGRIERTGQTSREMAMRLAEVLAPLVKRNADQLLAEWRGGAMEPPPSRIDEIEQQLRSQLEQGSNTQLLSAIEREKHAANPVRALACAVSTQLETAQLEQRRESLQYLAELTGWSLADLQRPTGWHGYWLLITRTHGHHKTEVFMGLPDLLMKLWAEGQAWLNQPAASDVRVNLSEDAPWFRMSLHRPCDSTRKDFSMVRCMPSASGLQWVKSSAWDREHFLGLRTWAFQNANFVEHGAPGQAWPRDLGGLRLRVEQVVEGNSAGTPETEDGVKTVAVYRGWLGEDPTFQHERRQVIRAEGLEHALVTNWLASELLQDVLVPLMSPVPADWWRMEARNSVIWIRTKPVTRYEASRYGLEPRGRTFLIHLVEQLPSGQLVPAPWRQKCAQAMAESLQKELATLMSRPPLAPDGQPG